MSDLIAKQKRHYEVAVFSGEGREKWSGYTLWYNPTWSNFVGIFKVEAASHREAVRTAIAIAKAHVKDGTKQAETVVGKAMSKRLTIITAKAHVKDGTKQAETVVGKAMSKRLTIITAKAHVKDGTTTKGGSQ